MNEFLNPELVEKLADTLGVASEFIVAAIWERVYFGAIWATVVALLLFAIAGVIYRWGSKLQRYRKEKDPRNDLGPAPEIVKYGLPGVVTAFALVQIREVLVVLLAPNYSFLWRLKTLLEQVL